MAADLQIPTVYDRRTLDLLADWRIIVGRVPLTWDADAGMSRRRPAQDATAAPLDLMLREAGLDPDAIDQVDQEECWRRLREGTRGWSRREAAEALLLRFGLLRGPGGVFFPQSSWLKFPGPKSLGNLTGAAYAPRWPRPAVSRISRTPTL